MEASFHRPGRVLVPSALLFTGAVAVALVSPPRFRAAALVKAEWATGTRSRSRGRGWTWQVDGSSGRGSGR